MREWIEPHSHARRNRCGTRLPLQSVTAASAESNEHQHVHHRRRGFALDRRVAKNTKVIIGEVSDRATGVLQPTDTPDH